MPVLGIDASAHGVHAVIVDGDGRVLARAHDPDPQKTVSVAKALLRKHKADAAGIVVGEDGPFSAEALPHDVAAITGVTRGFSCGPAAIAAETWVGAARGARHAIVLSIGDRVFAGFLLDGKPWTGAHNHAGAAAWLALNPVERQDYRKLGSLAAEVGVKGIARRLSWRIQAGDHSAVLERAGDLDAITATHVFEGARAGDGVAISVVRDTAKYIGMAVATLVAALDPEIVVIGGSVADARDLLLDPIRQECARRLPPSMIGDLRAEFSTLGEDAVAIGAARLAAPSAT